MPLHALHVSHILCHRLRVVTIVDKSLYYPTAANTVQITVQLFVVWRRGDLMVTALVPGLIERSGFEP